MTDYIDRQAAIAYAISGRIRALPTSEDGEDWIRTEEVRQNLLNVPSAEVEPVKHGRWSHHYDDELVSGTCTVCGWQSMIMETDVADMPYCPNCGAQMDLEEGESHDQN